MVKEKEILKLLSKGLFWALYAELNQMSIPLNKLHIMLRLIGLYCLEIAFSTN